ncbi:MAG: hypothetical protein AB7O97_20900 [Planctomycetota bacterium]
MTATPAPPVGSRFRALVRVVDDALRGSYSSDDQLAAGEVRVPVPRMLLLAALLGAVYGVCVATFGLRAGGGAAWAQLLQAAWKLPAVFLLTVAVTLPSLCVFGALLRLPLGLKAIVRLLLLAIFVQLAVLASLGPVFVFFAASTPSYDFLLLLHVAISTVGGFIGLSGLFRSVQVMLRGRDPVHLASGRRLFLFWCMLFALVGAQMGWLLRPFLTAAAVPGLPETTSFFDAVWTSVGRIFGRG